MGAFSKIQNPGQYGNCKRYAKKDNILISFVRDEFKYFCHFSPNSWLEAG